MWLPVKDAESGWTELSGSSQTSTLGETGTEVQWRWCLKRKKTTTKACDCQVSSQGSQCAESRVLLEHFPWFTIQGQAAEIWRIVTRFWITRCLIFFFSTCLVTSSRRCCWRLTGLSPLQPAANKITRVKRALAERCAEIISGVGGGRRWVEVVDRLMGGVKTHLFWPQLSIDVSGADKAS